jgi:ribosomal protein S18 acetylase RimI-like enzyme
MTALQDQLIARFGRLTRRFVLRPEEAGDRAFLFDLYCRCQAENHARYGLDILATLGMPMLEMQFDNQYRGFRAAYPAASFLLPVTADGGEPVGRMIADWPGDGTAHGVDVAVLPDRREGAPGLLMLRTWMAVADRNGLGCSLRVLPDNPARLIYRRLGFVEADLNEMPLRMVRQVPVGWAPGPTHSIRPGFPHRDQ